MTYLVFKGNKFIGHTEDRKVLKRFLKERKTKYRVEEIETKLLGDDFKDSNDFYSRELMLYEHHNHVMTEQDLIDATIIGRGRLKELFESMKAVRKELKNVKLDKDEERTIGIYFGFIEQMSEDLTNPESCVFLEDYTDMNDIIKMMMTVR